MSDALQSRLYFGGPSARSSTTPGFTNFALDANNDSIEFIFQAREAATLTRLGFRVGTITGTTPTYRISLQGVDSSGRASGTIKGGTNNALKTFNPTSLGWSANTWQWLTLDESYACARGEWLAIKVEYSSGTIDGSNNINVARSWNVGLNNARYFPIEVPAGSPTRQLVQPVFGYGSAGKAFGYPASATSSVSITNASSPREVGMRFETDASWGDTFKVVGVQFYASLFITGQITMRLYSGGGASDTTVLQDVTVESINSQATTTDRRTHELYFDESSLTALTYGNAYRIAFESLGATNSPFYYASVENAADWEAYPGGQKLKWTQRDSGGNWADTAERRMFDFALILEDTTEPSGGGGGLLLPPGMSGGCRG